MADDGVMIGFSDRPELLRLDRANRHGLVAGATGTGKTVTLQVLARAHAMNREAFAKSMLRTIGSQVGRELIRGVLGSLVASSRSRR